MVFISVFLIILTLPFSLCLAVKVVQVSQLSPSSSLSSSLPLPTSRNTSEQSSSGWVAY